MDETPKKKDELNENISKITEDLYSLEKNCDEFKQVYIIINSQSENFYRKLL